MNNDPQDDVHLVLVESGSMVYYFVGALSILTTWLGNIGSYWIGFLFIAFGAGFALGARKTFADLRHRGRLKLMDTYHAEQETKSERWLSRLRGW